MFKKGDSFFLLKWCLFLVCCNVFSQKEIYKSDFVFDDFKTDRHTGCIIMYEDNILFKASNQKVYSIDKKEGKINWEIKETKSDIIPYLHDNTLLYVNYENEVLRGAQFNLNTGEKIKDFPFESIVAKPYFLNNIMYAAVHFDGGKLIAYNLEENILIWQQNVGFGSEVQPVYLKDKIIANAEDDNWFEIDYNGKFLKSKSKTEIILDTTPIFVRKYKFLTHDGKEITQDFLKKNKLSNAEYKIKTTADNTFILSENQLFILGDNKKKVLVLDLETLVSLDSFYSGAYIEILEANQENIWFYCQNHLVNYDFKNKKLLRKVDLTKWEAQQAVLENRTIWLISNIDGQLYKLDFEPNQRMADEIEARAKMDFERFRCDVPDQKKIEAMKAAQEKLKNYK